MCLTKEPQQKQVSPCKYLQAALTFLNWISSGESFPLTEDSWSIDIGLVIDFVS